MFWRYFLIKFASPCTALLKKKRFSRKRRKIVFQALQHPCALHKWDISVLMLRMVIPPLIGNPDCNGYIKPSYWVDNHSLKKKEIMEGNRTWHMWVTNWKDTHQRDMLLSVSVSGSVFFSDLSGLSSWARSGTKTAVNIPSTSCCKNHPQVACAAKFPSSVNRWSFRCEMSWRLHCSDWTQSHEWSLQRIRRNTIHYSENCLFWAFETELFLKNIPADYTG